MPGIGTGADLINAAIHLARGNYAAAASTALFSAPGLKFIKGTAKLAKVGAGLVGRVAKTGANLSTNGANLSRHLGQLEKYGKGGFKELQDGRFRYYGNIKPAKNFGEMQGARLVREWNPATGNTRTWYETLDNAGKIRQVHPKYNNLPHYKFDSNGKYIGKW